MVTPPPTIQSRWGRERSHPHTGFSDKSLCLGVGQHGKTILSNVDFFFPAFVSLTCLLSQGTHYLFQTADNELESALLLFSAPISACYSYFKSLFRKELIEKDTVSISLLSSSQIALTLQLSSGCQFLTYHMLDFPLWLPQGEPILLKDPHQAGYGMQIPGQDWDRLSPAPTVTPLGKYAIHLL